MNGSVLIVDDEVIFTQHLEHYLHHKGYQVAGANSAQQARDIFRAWFPDVVLLDLRLPDADGIELMEEFRTAHPSARYIIITAHASIRSAVDATQRGASNYLTKPFEPDELLVAIKQALADQAKDEELKVLRRRVGHSNSKSRLTTPNSAGQPSEIFQKTLALAHQAAARQGMVLLLGESGSGKDYLASYIHTHSSRAEGPYFAINCAAVPPELAESELFGHEPGAFTGAQGRKRGLLELAERGTLLLNEIGELSPVLQAKLLSFLDSRSFTRVGGETSIHVDARLIAATNRDLEQEVAAGRFRKDLYYRLNVLAIRVPSLRERTEDLPGLTAEVLAQLEDELGMHATPEIEPAAMRLIQSYHWPGNIRELRNVLERAVMISDSGVITVDSLGLKVPDEGWLLTVRFPNGRSLHDTTREVARSIVLEALRRSAGNKQKASELLGISRHSLAYQLKSLKVHA